MYIYIYVYFRLISTSRSLKTLIFKEKHLMLQTYNLVVENRIIKYLFEYKFMIFEENVATLLRNIFNDEHYFADQSVTSIEHLK